MRGTSPHTAATGAATALGTPLDWVEHVTTCMVRGRRDIALPLVSAAGIILDFHIFFL